MYIKINFTIVFSGKRPVREYILCYTFIHKLMNNRQICQPTSGPAAVLCCVFRTHGIVKVPLTFIKKILYMKMNSSIVFSVKRLVRKYMFSCTFIHKWMNKARLKTCAAYVVECWVLKLSEVEWSWVLSDVCPRIEIDLAIELFNLET